LPVPACRQAGVLENLAILKILLAVLRTWHSRSLKSYIPFSAGQTISMVSLMALT
jgi:hypothetical protein